MLIVYIMCRIRIEVDVVVVKKVANYMINQLCGSGTYGTMEEASHTYIKENH
jgi:hypothetical protein